MEKLIEKNQNKIKIAYNQENQYKKLDKNRLKFEKKIIGQ